MSGASSKIRLERGREIFFIISCCVSRWLPCRCLIISRYQVPLSPPSWLFHLLCCFSFSMTTPPSSPHNYFSQLHAKNNKERNLCSLKSNVISISLYVEPYRELSRPWHCVVRALLWTPAACIEINFPRHSLLVRHTHHHHFCRVCVC